MPISCERVYFTITIRRFKMAKVTVQDSKAFSLNVNDVLVLGKNAALVALAAGLTFVGENLASADLGVYGPLLVPVVAVVIDTVVKWARNNAKDE
jgi:hypothetical protein